MKNLANINVYDDANLIVQTTGVCTKRCSGCYLSSTLGSMILNQILYNNYLSQLNKGDIVALRGGEISVVKGWFERFVSPAINMGLTVIIETNGYFIGKEDYEEILNNLSHQNLFVRISFDETHINKVAREVEFSKMSLFAKKAIEKGIQFGFYSLGMGRKQIKDFLRGTKLQPYQKYFHILKKYDDISKVSLKGKYLRADGQLLNRVVG